MAKTKKSETRCKVCGFDPAERYGGGMMKHRAEDRKLAKKHCERSNDYRHKVKPIWKNCCGTLDYYCVTLIERDIPLWKRGYK